MEDLGNTNKQRHDTIDSTQEETLYINFWGLVLFGLVWFGGFYGISTFVGYLTPNPFLWK